MEPGTAVRPSALTGTHIRVRLAAPEWGGIKMLNLLEVDDFNVLAQ